METVTLAKNKTPAYADLSLFPVLPLFLGFVFGFFSHFSARHLLSMRCIQLMAARSSDRPGGIGFNSSLRLGFDVAR